MYVCVKVWDPLARELGSRGLPCMRLEVNLSPLLEQLAVLTTEPFL